MTEPALEVAPERQRAVDQVRGVIDAMARSVVDNEDAVRIHLWLGGPRAGDRCQRLVVEIEVACDAHGRHEIGRVIGPGGAHIKAIRTVANLCASKLGFKLDLDVREPAGEARVERRDPLHKR